MAISGAVVSILAITGAVLTLFGTFIYHLFTSGKKPEE